MEYRNGYYLCEACDQSNYLRKPDRPPWWKFRKAR